MVNCFVDLKCPFVGQQQQPQAEHGVIAGEKGNKVEWINYLFVRQHG